MSPPIEKALGTEIARKYGVKLSQTFVSLSRTYSTNNLATTKAIKADLDALDKQCRGEYTLLQKAKRAKIMAQFRGPVKAMWDAFYKAKVVEQEFYYTHDLFAPDIPAQNYLTAVLEELHAAGQLPNPQAVAEGRDVLERLSKENGLISAFDYTIKPEDRVSSRALDDVR